jgi:hypothetical protein
MKTVKVMAAILIIILIVPGILACGSQPAEKANFNFDLKYGVGAKNEIDTFHGKFTKDMADSPSITVTLKLSEAEMEEIYQKMLDIDFFSYPDTFAVTPGPNEATQLVTPVNSYNFTVERNAQTKTLNWEDSILNPNIKADKLRELIVMIQRMIIAKEEYKELPDPGHAYL